MRHTIIAAAFAVIASLVATAFQAAAENLPSRKPGLWEITTVAAGTGMTTIKTCIGPGDSIAAPADSGACSQPKAKRMGDEIYVEVVCKKTFGKEILSTAFTGDFASRYHAIMKITFDPPEGVRNMGVVIDGKYLGPDCGAAGEQGAGK